MTRRTCSLALTLAMVLALGPSAFAEIASDTREHSVGKTVTLQIDRGVPEKGMMPVDLTLDDGTGETSIGDGGQFIWLNRFTPDPADFPFQLEQVSALIATTGVTVGDAIEIVVYSDTDGDGDPGTGAVLLASIDEVVQNNDGVTFNVYDLASPVVLDGPGDVIIGLINRYSFEGNGDFPASLDQTASMARSWAATYLVGDVPDDPSLPADEQWDLIDNFGFPGNWVVRGAGTTIAPVEPIVNIPTLDTFGLIGLSLILLLAAMAVLKRKVA